MSGLLNPLKTAATDTGLDGHGKPLPYDVNGIDAEGLVRLSDGTFWVGEENGPSIAHFAADGRMIVRHVPKGTEGEFAGAHYDVKGTLPAILTKRAINRGIETMAVSPDERSSISSCRTRSPIRTGRPTARPRTRACSRSSARP